MLYNDSLTYTAKSIVDNLQMDKKMAAQTISSLIKNKVLIGEEPDARGEYDDDKEFKLNQGYTNNKYKVTIVCFSLLSHPLRLTSRRPLCELIPAKRIRRSRET